MEIIDDKSNRLKHARQTPIRCIRNQFNRIVERIIPSKKSEVVEPNGSSASYKTTRYRISYEYIIHRINSKGEIIYYDTHKIPMICTRHFNKPKLIGSIITIDKHRYRIIKKL